MQRIIGMYKQFLWEPLWFKILIIASLLAAVVFSSSFFADHGYYQSIAKIAAAIFFGAYGIKFRSNTRIAVIFFGAAALCVFLSWTYLNN